MLYLPRLFVYHAGCRQESESYKMLLIMEYKLLYYITYPSMIATIISGSLLGIFSITFAWLHVKLLLIFVMLIFHFGNSIFYRRFKNHKNTRSHRFFRIINEIPAILMVAIVFLVVLQS